MVSANDSQTDKKDVYLHQALQINVAISGISKMENSLGRVLFKSDWGEWVKQMLCWMQNKQHAQSRLAIAANDY